MLVWFKFVLPKASLRSPPFILSKKLAGKLVSKVHPCHAWTKTVPLDVSIKGKLGSEEQLNHAKERFVTPDVLIKGKLVNKMQFAHALLTLVALDVSISGKLVNELHPAHAAKKRVPFAVLISGKLVISALLRQKEEKLVTAPYPAVAPLATKYASVDELSASVKASLRKSAPTMALPGKNAPPRL